MYLDGPPLVCTPFSVHFHNPSHTYAKHAPYKCVRTPLHTLKANRGTVFKSTTAYYCLWPLTYAYPLPPHAPPRSSSLPLPLSLSPTPALRLPSSPPLLPVALQVNPSSGPAKKSYLGPAYIAKSQTEVSLAAAVPIVVVVVGGTARQADAATEAEAQGPQGQGGQPSGGGGMVLCAHHQRGRWATRASQI